MDDQEHLSEIEGEEEVEGPGTVRQLLPYIGIGLLLALVAITLISRGARGGRAIETARADSVTGLNVSLLDARVDEENYELTVRWLLENKRPMTLCSISWSWTLADGTYRYLDTDLVVYIYEPLVGPNEWSGRVEDPKHLDLVLVSCD